MKTLFKKKVKVKLLKIKFVFIVLSLINCKSNPVKNTKFIEFKITDNKMLFDGKKNNADNFYQYMTFFDATNKNQLIDLIFIENTDSIFHYSLTTKNEFGRIIHFLEVKNGEVLKEYIYNSSYKNINLGFFLYKKYCFHCHHNKKESIGKSMMQLELLNNSEFEKSYLNYEHEIKMNKDEIKAIYDYFNK